MNQDLGWRKRQIALDKMAENARELGLDYEPSIIETARELGFKNSSNPDLYDVMLASYKSIEAFAKLVREDEREACAKICDELANDENTDEYINGANWCSVRIRARGNT